jgi:hypothetical protein
MSSKIGDSPEEVQRRMQLHSDFKLMELEREIRIGIRISPKKVLDRLTTEALLDYLQIVRGIEVSPEEGRKNLEG